MTDSTSTSTSTAADPNNQHGYDVFINHCGPETLTTKLYCRLLFNGFRVLLNKKELQQGDNLPSHIETAIKSASVHVAIFSPQYAGSNWCLNELLLMSGAPIIPVYYHVRPVDLRRKDGVYTQALQNLEKKKQRYSSVTIENWRNALSRVAHMRGLDLEAFNCDERELVEKVVERVLERLLKKGKNTRLNVALYPSGLDEKVQEFETTVELQRHSGGVKVVGIAGMGGVGKTTLAKEFFDRKKSCYSKSFFLYDVREIARRSSLHSLQRELLKGLTNLDLNIDSIDQGIEMLKKHLSDLSSHVLLVLDNVDHVDQVAALFPVTVKDVLRPHSLILITSRDKDVLASSGAQEFMLTGLGPQHSRELFCLHAFYQPHSLPGFEYWVDEFLRACDGLPLSLKVFGSLLCGRNKKSYWEYQLVRHRRILPTEIHERLKISYDSLYREEQQIFLDIACSSIGKNLNTARRSWDALGWEGFLGFQNLQNKCIVEVDGKNCIRMHNHLRALEEEELLRNDATEASGTENMDIDVTEALGLSRSGTQNMEIDVAEASGLPLAGTDNMGIDE